MVNEFCHYYTNLVTIIIMTFLKKMSLFFARDLIVLRRWFPRTNATVPPSHCCISLTRFLKYLKSLTRFLKYLKSLTRFLKHLKSLTRFLKHLKSLTRFLKHVKSLNVGLRHRVGSIADLAHGPLLKNFASQSCMRGRGDAPTALHCVRQELQRSAGPLRIAAAMSGTS